MAKTSKPTWIWYPGDFEVWLGNQFNNRRTERGAMFPPFWKQDSHYPTVEFSREVELQEEEQIAIRTEGQFNLMLDGKLQYGQPATFTLPAGRHKLNLKVWNQATPPALFIEGETVATDQSWLATYEDKIWIDENGVAHGSGIYVPAASWKFDDIDTPPSSFRLERTPMQPVKAERRGEGTLYDFGKETFGYVRLGGLRGTARVYYGESEQEALDKEHCETLDVVAEGQEPGSKAFRFVYVETEPGAAYDSVGMDYEYAPQDAARSGSFRSSSEELNRIWEVGAYTMDLTTREFFMDGIKRDRWTWSGDAIQSYLMNYYLRFDTDCVKRTIRQLRGKDPVTAHVNTIMDYTFYWFKSISDYYDYTGDSDFLREIYPRMVTLMDYCLQRTDGEGMADGKADDWIFVDWVDFPMHKRGVLAFEQILFCKALQAMARTAEVLLADQPAALPQGSLTAGDYRKAADRYRALADGLLRKLKPTFWDEERHAFMHAIEDGRLNPQVTKFPNMMAVIYDLVTGQDSRDIMDHVMLNPSIDAITTPYMRFYELEALCKMGRQKEVLPEILAYWGGMLKEGATSFWEKYNPGEQGTEHLAMYGRPYGKSLCHAWGASPIYLLGRYFLGVSPTSPGYQTYEVRPCLAGLEWMEGDVPTPYGPIHIKINRHEVTVSACGGEGTLILGSERYDIRAGEALSVRTAG